MGKSKKDLLTSGTDDFFDDYNNSVKKEEKTDAPRAENMATDEEIITRIIEKKVIKHKKLVLSLRQSLYNELYEYCKTNDKNITEAIRDAITDMLAKENK